MDYGRFSGTENIDYALKQTHSFSLFSLANRSRLCLKTVPNIWFRSMVFNATINNISVILWQSVALVEETRVPGKDH